MLARLVVPPVLVTSPELPVETVSYILSVVWGGGAKEYTRQGEGYQYDHVCRISR